MYICTTVNILKKWPLPHIATILVKMIVDSIVNYCANGYHGLTTDQMFVCVWHRSCYFKVRLT